MIAADWTRGGATFSSDRTYRHHLWRARGELTGGYVFAPPMARSIGVVMLNPSSAGEDPIHGNDLTIRKLIGFCDRWSFNHFAVANLSDYVATKPDELHQMGYPISRDRDRYLCDVIASCEMVLVAWGNISPRIRHFPTQVLDLCDVLKKPTVCIGVTAQRDPVHPSRAGYTSAPLPYAHR